MEMWLIVVIGIAAAWLFVGTVLGIAGGFDIIRATELDLVPRTRWYWILLVAVYPDILLRATWLAFLAMCGWHPR